MFGGSKKADELAVLLEEFETETQAALAKLAKRIEALETQVKALGEENKALARQIAVLKAKPVEPVSEKPQLPMQTRFYLAAPTPDGLFTDVSRQEKVGVSVYQLITEDNRQGRFTLLGTQDAIATALISVSQFVKPACKIAGIVPSRASSVVTDEDGLAQREGDGWRVVRKAAIRFA